MVIYTHLSLLVTSLHFTSTPVLDFPSSLHNLTLTRSPRRPHSLLSLTRSHSHPLPYHCTHSLLAASPVTASPLHPPSSNTLPPPRQQPLPPPYSYLLHLHILPHSLPSPTSVLPLISLTFSSLISPHILNPPFPIVSSPFVCIFNFPIYPFLSLNSFSLSLLPPSPSIF